MRHTNNSGRFASVASFAKTWLSAFAPAVLHLWVLRVVLLLPGLDAALAEHIQRYVSERSLFDVTCTPAEHRVATATGTVLRDSSSPCPCSASSPTLSAPYHIPSAPKSRDTLCASEDVDFNHSSSLLPNLPLDPASDTSDPPRVFFLPSRRRSSDAAWKGGHDRSADAPHTAGDDNKAVHSSLDRTSDGFRNPNASLENLTISAPPCHRVPLAPIDSSASVFSHKPLVGTYFVGDPSSQPHETFCPGAEGDAYLYGSTSHSQEEQYAEPFDSRTPFDVYHDTNDTEFTDLGDAESSEDDDKPFYVVAELFRYQEWARNYQQQSSPEQSSPELGTSSDDVSSETGPEDYVTGYESDKENIQPVFVHSSDSDVKNIRPVASHYHDSDVKSAQPRVSEPPRRVDLSQNLRFPTRPALRRLHAHLAASSESSAESDEENSDPRSRHERSVDHPSAADALSLVISERPEQRAPLSDCTDLYASVHTSSDSDTRVGDEEDLYDSGWETDAGSPNEDSDTAEDSDYDQSEQQTRPYVLPPGAVRLRNGENTSWLTKRLGSGGYGNVYLSHYRGSDMAIKVIKKANMYGVGEPGRKQVLNELTHWRKITESDRPFLTRLVCSFDDDDSVYFLMRLHHQNLDERIRGGHRLSPYEVKLYSAELVSALASLHKLGIMHRDIKPANILIAPDGHLALADFGLSYSPANPRGRLTFHQCHSWDKVGTPGYWAPEVRLFNPRKGVKPISDVYSLGIVILEMALCGQDPFFAGSTPAEIDEAMATKPIPYAELRKADFDLADLIQKMLGTTLPPAKPDRWTAEALKDHPYLRDLFLCGVESGLHMPEHIPLAPEPPTGPCELNIFDFWTPLPDTALASEKTAAMLCDQHKNYLDLLEVDRIEKPYEYFCPQDRLSLAVYGWPAPEIARDVE